MTRRIESALSPAEASLNRVGLECGEQWALKRLKTALIEHHGNARLAANKLGFSMRTLTRLKTRSSAVQYVLSEYAMGRAGACRLARAARESTG
jgi:hypothetical protein